MSKPDKKDNIFRKMRKSIPGLTQYQLGKELNYCQTAMSKVENNQKTPDVFMLYDYCKFFGISMESVVEILRKADGYVQTSDHQRSGSATQYEP